MRKVFILLWLLAGVSLFSFHYNYGEKHVKRVEAWEFLQELEAMELEEDRNIDEILSRYDDGEPNSVPKDLVDMLPEDEDPRVFHQIKLKQASLRLDALDLGNSLDELYELLIECSNAYGDNDSLTQTVRETLGKGHYMAAWVLHSSGAPEKEWRPFAERARQIFRYLAEQKDSKAYRDYEERVEDAVKQVSEESGVGHD